MAVPRASATRRRAEGQGRGVRTALRRTASLCQVLCCPLDSESELTTLRNRRPDLARILQDLSPAPSTSRRSQARA